MLGLVLGSFINALVWRVHEQERLGDNTSKTAQIKRSELSVLHGRSMCPYCRHRLAGKDLVPVFSWLWLRGKCRYCQKRIAWQYPAVELSIPLLFIFSYIFWPYGLHGSGLLRFILWLVFLTGFGALTIYDIRWKLLPNRILYPLITLAGLQVIIVFLFYNGTLSEVTSAIWGSLILGGGFYVLYQLSQGRWIGGGDVKLGVLLGLLVGGPLNSILLLFLASFIGTLYAIPLMISRKFNRTSQLAFGPFLIIAAIIVGLFGNSIIAWYKRKLYL